MGTIRSTDAELLDSAGRGDEAAFTSLYRRHHEAVRRLAVTYRRRHQPDDLVDGTFGQVVAQLRERSRPPDSFRAHLFATVRRQAGQHPEIATAGVTDDVPGPVAAVTGHLALGGADRATTNAAFEALPTRWQVVAWHTTVDGCGPDALADRLGVSPAAAETLARRATRLLRRAYLSAHIAAAPRPSCTPHRQQLEAYAAGTLGVPARAAVQDHVARCDACHTLVAALDDVEERVALSMVPLFPDAVRTRRTGTPAPLAVGVTAQDRAVHASSTALPFRSHRPRHLARSGVMRRLSRRMTTGRPDTPSRGRQALVPVAAAAAALVTLVAGLAIVGTAVTGEDEDGTVVEAGGEDGAVVEDGEPAPTTSDDMRAPAGGPGSSPPSTTAPTAPTGAGNRTRPGRPSPSSTADPSPPGTAPATTTGSSSSSTTAGDAHGAGPGSGGAGTASPPTAPATTGRPTSGPMVVLAVPAWTPTPTGGGTLTIALDRPVPLGATGMDMQPPADEPEVVVGILLSEAVEPDGALGDRCEARPVDDRTRLTCAIAAPAPGAMTALRIDTVVEAPGQTATVTAGYGHHDLGRETLDLRRWDTRGTPTTGRRTTPTTGATTTSSAPT